MSSALHGQHRQIGYYRQRPLRRAAKNAFETRLPKFLIAPEQCAAPETLFDFTPDSLCLEIGFGDGEYLLQQARAHPETGFIGCEPYRNGVARFLSQLDDQKNRNVRLYHGDIRTILPHCADGMFAQIVLLYPDPWPKYRHRHRRLIQPDIIEQLRRIMIAKAQFLFASDDAQITAWVLAHFLAARGFVWCDRLTQTPAPPFLTRYERNPRTTDFRPIRLVFSRNTP